MSKKVVIGSLVACALMGLAAVGCEKKAEPAKPAPAPAPASK